MLKNRSLARRLLVGAVIWCLVVLFGGAFMLTAVYRAQTMELLEQDINASLVALSRAVIGTDDGSLQADRSRLPADPRYETPLSGHYWAIAAFETSQRLSDQDIRSNSLWKDDLPLTDPLVQAALAAPGATQFADIEGPAGERLRVGVRVIVLETRDRRALLFAGADQAETDQGARRFLILLIGAMAFLAGGVLIAMVVLARLVLNPLKRVENDVAQIREGERTRLDSDYPAEVSDLTRELNKLLDHNREIVERAHTHVGNLAHALKTPLAILRNEANGDTPLDELVRRQVETMHTSVSHYLHRARAAAQAQPLRARTQLAPVLDAMARMLNRLFEDKGVEVTTDCDGDVVFRGEKQHLDEMLGNLMENGCKWARARVAVSVEDRPDALVIHVDDDGRGLPVEERAAALGRGVRLDETAPGSGLGLSIVSELAEIHSGTLELSESPLGGLRASLRFPRA